MTTHDAEDREFQLQEAEGMVTRLREHLRGAERCRASGQVSDAARQESLANALLEVIVKRLRRRLERYARSYFRSDEDTFQDAVGEMALEVCRRIKNLTSYAAFERVFNLCVRHAIIDAAKKVRRENGLDVHGQPDTAGHRLVSVEDLPGAGEGKGPSWEERVADPSANFVMRVLGAAVADDLIARLPTPRHARIFEHRLVGMEWGEVSARVGVSDRTARKYYDEAKACLREAVLSAAAQEIADDTPRKE